MFFERHRERRQLKRQYKLERRALKQSYRERLLGMWMSNGRNESTNNTAVPVNGNNTAAQYEHIETTVVMPPLSLPAPASVSPFISPYTSTYPSTSIPHPQQAYSDSHNTRSHNSHGINNPVHMMTVDTSPSSPKKTATYAQLNSLSHNDSHTHTHTDTDNDMSHPIYPPPAYSKSLY